MLVTICVVSVVFLVYGYFSYPLIQNKFMSITGLANVN
jgi:hypothetical protein